MSENLPRWFQATFCGQVFVEALLFLQGHIGQQPLDAVPSFGGSTSSTAEGSYRLWDPSKVPTPSKIVAALDKFIVGQEATKKVRPCICTNQYALETHFMCILISSCTTDVPGLRGASMARTIAGMILCCTCV